MPMVLPVSRPSSLFSMHGPSSDAFLSCNLLQKPVHIIFALILDDEDCKEIAAVVFQPPTVCVRSNSQRDVRLKALQNLGYRDALCNHEDGHAPPNLPVPNNSSLRSRPRKVSSQGSALDYLRHTPQQHVAPARHSVCTLPIAPPTPPALQQGVAPSWGEQQSLDELHAGAGPSLGSVPGQPLRPQQSWGDGPNQLQLQGSRFGPDPITSGIVVPSMSQQSTHASPWHTPQSAPSPEVQVAHGDPAYGSEVNVPAPMPRQSQQAPGRTQHPHQQLQAVAAGISGRDKRRRSALGGHAGSHSMPCTPEPGDGRSWGTGYIENLSAGNCFPQGSASGQPRHSPLQPGLASPTDPLHGGDASVLRPEVSTHIPSRRQQPTGLQVDQYASRAHGEEWAPPILRTSVLEPGSLWHTTQHRSDVGASHPATHGMSADSGAGHSSFPQALQAQFRDMWPERVSVGPLPEATPSSQHAPVNAYVTHGPDSIDTDCYVGCSTPAAQVRGAVPGPSGVSVQAGAPHAASAGTYAPSQIPSVPGIFEPVGGLIATTAHDPSSAEVDLQPAKPHENQSSFCHVRCWDDLEGLRTKRPRYDDQDELTKEEFDDALVRFCSGIPAQDWSRHLYTRRVFYIHGQCCVIRQQVIAMRTQIHPYEPPDQGPAMMTGNLLKAVCEYTCALHRSM